MKKMGLGLSLALAALGFLMSPVQSAASSAADEAFLASLAAAPAPTLAAARPAAGQEKSVCFAAANCGSYTITCSGNQSVTSCSAADRNCSVGQRGRVTCDGVTTVCNETCFDCGQLENNCASNCYPCNYNFTCYPATQDSVCRCNFRTCPV